MVGEMEEGLSCVECEYDLRAAPREGVCPECGRAVEETIEMGPMRRWRRRFWWGLVGLGVGMFLQGLVPAVVYSPWSYSWAGRVNRDGVVTVAEAVVWAGAGWLVTRPAPLPGWWNPRRRRRIILLAAMMLGLIGVVEIVAYSTVARWVDVTLMVAYGLGPLVEAVIIFLALGVWEDVRVVMRRRWPGVLAKAVRWMLGYSMLSLAVFGLIVSCFRIGYGGIPPPGGNWIPEPWRFWFDLLLFSVAGPMRFLMYWGSMGVMGVYLWMFRRMGKLKHAERG